ncbi:aquaporin family protein, partial [Acinetobacter baumannii]|nr:aquaporin family protein [Acinetobacter baumannii]
GYMLAQLVGALLATPLFNWLMGVDAAPAQASGTTIAPAQAVPRHRQAS